MREYDSFLSSTSKIMLARNFSFGSFDGDNRNVLRFWTTLLEDRSTW